MARALRLTLALVLAALALTIPAPGSVLKLRRFPTAHHWMGIRS